MQRICRDIVELCSAINQLDITDIYRLLNPMTAEHTFFSRSHGAFIKTDHILGHKAHLNKFKKKKSQNVYFQITMELN